MRVMRVQEGRVAPVYHWARSVQESSVLQADGAIEAPVVYSADYQRYELLSAQVGDSSVPPLADLYLYFEPLQMKAASGEVGRQKYSQFQRDTRPP